MSVSTRIFSTLALLIPVWAPIALGDTRKNVDRVCPLCSTKFTAVVIMSGTRFGVRLDLRPLGAIASPIPLAVCPKCGLVLHKPMSEKYSADELKQLRGIIEADAYHALDTKAPSYQRLAMLYEGLHRPPEDIGNAYLMASWQTEKEEKLNQALLAKSQEWFQKYLDMSPEKDEGRQTIAFLRGELLRRLGRFDEAKRQFDRLAGLKNFQEDPFPRLITQELSLIQAKDATPHEMARKAP